MSLSAESLPFGPLLVRLVREAGLPRFWRWWTRELAELVPASVRMRLSGRAGELALAFERDADPGMGTGSTGWRATVWRFDGSTWNQLEPLATPPDARAFLTALGKLTGGNGELPAVTLVIPAGQAVVKRMSLPAAVEENLRQSIQYEFDRYTPFRPEQVHFDVAVANRDLAANRIDVALGFALRQIVDDAVKIAEARGLKVGRVAPVGIHGDGDLLNLLPPERRIRSHAALLRWLIPVLIVAALGATAVVFPIWQKRDYAIRLGPLLAQAKREADAASNLRDELDKLASKYNFLLQKKQGYPLLVQIWDDITRRMPDDVWLMQLDVKTANNAKEVQLQGNAPAASKTIDYLTDSQLLTDIAFKSNIQRFGNAPERFHLGATVRPASPQSAPVTPSAEAPAGTDKPAAAADKGNAAAAPAVDPAKASAPPSTPPAAAAGITPPPTEAAGAKAPPPAPPAAVPPAKPPIGPALPPPTQPPAAPGGKSR